MIDYFNITIDGDDFPKIGKKVVVRQPSGVKTKSFTEVKVSAGKYAPHFNVRVETNGQRIRFHGSPAQWLQGHNGMGSNDLRGLVKKTIRLAFETLEMDCPASVSKAIISGNYAVDEVHIAEHYAMPASLIAKLCNDIRRYGAASLKATPISPGIGVRLWPGSRDREVLIYDKQNYFMDNHLRHKYKLLGKMPMNFDRIGTGLYFDQMMDQYLAHGVRIETRHKRDLKKKNLSLNKGLAWNPDVARALHVKTVNGIPLQDLPPLDIREQVIQKADFKYRALMALWLDGRDPKAFCASPATYYRHRKEILDQCGIDLSVPALMVEDISWKSLTDPINIMEPPEWAMESGFVYEPKRWDSFVDATQYERAWLNGEKV
ncbi:phage/plasmid replication protein [Comamonas sp. F1-6]|uniref:phage/plasmid replication domain-containing protein n=1 Tax=Comamonas sp. F1-6 TaxID=673550 RepID=UPI0031DEF3A3